jgi:hypothetical protein
MANDAVAPKSSGGFDGGKQKRPFSQGEQALAKRTSGGAGELIQPFISTCSASRSKRNIQAYDPPTLRRCMSWHPAG